MNNLRHETIYDIIKNRFAPLLTHDNFDLVTVIPDNVYTTLPNVDWLRDMVINDAIIAPELKKYRNEIFDCDDFVMYLKTKVSLRIANTSSYPYPVAVGYIITERHAFNFGVLDDNRLFILNTQSDDVGHIIPSNHNDTISFMKLTKINVIKNIYI
ncbi:MAG TPA: hypothetical protein PK776_06630 [Flavobacterium sp.]|nr:hypothetical protein [Flavobacterium sp.]